MSISKSLRKANYLSGLGSGLSEIGRILEENRKKEEQKKLYDTIVSYWDKYQEGQKSASMDRGLKEGGQVNNVFSPANFTGRNLAGETPAGMNLNVNIPKTVQQENMAPVPPETQTKVFTPQEKYKKAETNLNEFVQSITPLIMNPNVDESQLSRVNVLSNLAKQQTESLKPKTGTISERDPFKRYVKTDELGNETTIQEAGNKPKLFDIEGDFKNPKTKTHWSFDKQTGKYFDTGIPYDPNESKTTVNIKQGKENTLDKDTAKLIADLKNFKPYTIDDEGKQIPMSPEDIKYNKDKTLENIKLQLLSPRGYQFINNIEELWRAGDKTGTKKYLSPKELYDEAVKHAESGDIDETVQDEIATYLKYYSDDIYKGLSTNANK